VRTNRDFIDTFEKYSVFQITSKIPKKDIPAEELIYHMRISKKGYDPHMEEDTFLWKFKKKVDITTVRGASFDFHHMPFLCTIANNIKEWPKFQYVLMYNFRKDPENMTTKPEWSPFYDLGVFGDILKAFPRLKGYFQRGGYINGAGGIQKHSHLKTLIFESRGVNELFFKNILECELPKLQRFDVHIGRDRNKCVTDISVFDKLFSGKCFPKLNHLKLGGSYIADKIAYELAKSPILPNLKALDLSGGNLHDQGAEILINNIENLKLKKLDISHNALSREFCASLQNVSKRSKTKISYSNQYRDHQISSRDRVYERKLEKFLMDSGLWWVK